MNKNERWLAISENNYRLITCYGEWVRANGWVEIRRVTVKINRNFRREFLWAAFFGGIENEFCGSLLQINFILLVLTVESGINL